MNPNNMERLGTTFSDRMKATAAAAFKLTMELGTINTNLSLSTDSLKRAIPKGAYMVNLALTGSIRTSSETHTHSDGTEGGGHSHELPSAFRGLQAGDRVLVAWCGNEPVVIAIVVSS